MRAAISETAAVRAPLLGVRGLTATYGILLVYVCNQNPSNGVLPLEGVPWVVPFIGLVLFVYSVLLGRTRTGRYMDAIGANPEAARRAGINVQLVRRIAFTLTAMTAGLAGLVYIGFLGSISTDLQGGNYTLYAVAAAVIGGASLFGGREKPLHALLGGLVIGVVYNGLALMNISAQGQFIATGIVLLVAATVDAALRGRGTTAA